MTPSEFNKLWEAIYKYDGTPDTMLVNREAYERVADILDPWASLRRLVRRVDEEGGTSRRDASARPDKARNPGARSEVPS